MHIAYALAFFVFVGLCETLRHGIFGLTSYETTGIIYGTLILLALLMLRGDVVNLLRQPQNGLYGRMRLEWSWRRSLLGIALLPLLWAVPIFYGMTLMQINFQTVSADKLIELLAVELFLIAMAEELFFREAAIKAFGADLFAVFLVSGLCSLIFHMPAGVPAAVIAAGSGLFYTALRLSGTNIVIVALAHAATTVMFTQVLTLGLTGPDEWTYSMTFFSASAALTFFIFYVFSVNRRRFDYA